MIITPFQSHAITRACAGPNIVVAINRSTRCEQTCARLASETINAPVPSGCFVHVSIAGGAA
jgi:hypothetical protein